MSMPRFGHRTPHTDTRTQTHSHRERDSEIERRRGGGGEKGMPGPDASAMFAHRRFLCPPLAPATGCPVLM
eukprot:2655994-Rhodomonas_salina.1